SARRPRGHQPPCGIPSLIATSSAARSAPVCPPEMIFLIIVSMAIAILFLAWPMMISELRAAVKAYGVETYRRHIFLCADQTEPKCAPKEKGLESWQFLKQRLKELQLVGPEPLVYRTKANCLRICT